MEIYMDSRLVDVRYGIKSYSAHRQPELPYNNVYEISGRKTNIWVPGNGPVSPACDPEYVQNVLYGAFGLPFPEGQSPGPSIPYHGRS